MGSRPSPVDLFRNGELRACIAVTQGADTAPLRILRARALIRLGNEEQALRELESLADSNIAAAGLSAQCYASIGNPYAAREVAAWTESAHGDIAEQFEVGYSRFLIAWSIGAIHEIEPALSRIECGNDPHLRARLLVARAWGFAEKYDYSRQAQLLLETAEILCNDRRARDVSLLAAVAKSLAHLAREISLPSFEAVAKIANAVPWTDDLNEERFFCSRNLAWAFALRGSHDDALEQMWRAHDLAPSLRWRISSLADMSYLARMVGDDRSSNATLRHATILATDCEWNSSGEDRTTLLYLAELNADRDTDAAVTMLALYDAIEMAMSKRFSLAHDPRLRAMENHAGGCVLAALGQPEDAALLLSEAYRAFQSVFHYTRRAASSALRMYEVTGKKSWLECARGAVAQFPGSSIIANDIRRQANGHGDPRYARLTLTQRRVFHLIYQGYVDEQIAEELSISIHTARNHVASVRRIFGAHSKNEIIAIARSYGSIA